MIKKKSLNVSRKPSKATNKRTTFGRDLIAGAKQILAHIEGRKMMKQYLCLYRLT
jgi:6-phosphogluconolactonase/glucosamine-6-phosphate isomerase/deaminase